MRTRAWFLDDEGRKVEAEVRAAGGEVTCVHPDVTREADWRGGVAAAVERYGTGSSTSPPTRRPT
jgi:hypothetical protein